MKHKVIDTPGNPSTGTKALHDDAVLSAADRVINHYKYLLDKCYLTRKTKYGLPNVNEIRPKAEQLISEYENLKKGCG